MVNGASRGNLLGLAMVVGLFAFFLADAMPSGLNAVAAFGIAVGALLVVFFVLAVVAVALKRRHEPRPAPITTFGASAPTYKAPPPSWTYPGPSWAAKPAGPQGASSPAGVSYREPAADRDPAATSRPETSPAEFRAAFDVLLDLVDQRPAGQIDNLEALILRYLATEPDRRIDELERLLEAAGDASLWIEFAGFVRLANRAPESAIGEARAVLRHRMSQR